MSIRESGVFSVDKILNIPTIEAMRVIAAEVVGSNKGAGEYIQLSDETISAINDIFIKRKAAYFLNCMDLSKKIQQCYTDDPLKIHVSRDNAALKINEIGFTLRHSQNK